FLLLTTHYPAEKPMYPIWHAALGFGKRLSVANLIYQNAFPPLNVMPGTESQSFPGSGSFGLLLAGSTGHLAIAPTRDPKLLPSRSGFSLTLTPVPAPKVAAVIPCCATAAAPAISTPHSTYFPSAPLA